MHRSKYEETSQQVSDDIQKKRNPTKELINFDQISNKSYDFHRARQWHPTKSELGETKVRN
jgi:hypothetical protein